MSNHSPQPWRGSVRLWQPSSLEMEWPRAHIEGMGKARIIITEHPPSYEVWVEQDGRRFLFAIAGSLEDAEEDAREAVREYWPQSGQEEK
jgi:hypothetical protein